MLVRRSDRDPHRSRRAEAGEGADDHPLAEQRLEPGLCILADLRVEKVADRGARYLEPRPAQNVLELPQAVAIARAAPLKRLSSRTAPSRSSAATR